MKKTQTIVDRERLGSDYIESKQDFSNVLSQVKQLSTTTWNNPWFYGPIGIAVFAVTISIVSLNPTIAKDVHSEAKVKDIIKPIVSQKNVEPETKELLKPVPAKTVKPISEFNEKKIPPTTAVIEKINESIEDKKFSIVELEKTTVIETRKVASNNRFPHIAGIFKGEIQLQDLFSETGIELNPRVKIISFELNYFNGKSNVVDKIEGNTIPTHLYSTMELYNIGQMIFITNIKAVDERSKVFVLPSINYKPIITE